MKQLALATVGFERYAKTTRRATFLAEMERVVPWPVLSGLNESLHMTVRANHRNRAEIPGSRTVRADSDPGEIHPHGGLQREQTCCSDRATDRHTGAGRTVRGAVADQDGAQTELFGEERKRYIGRAFGSGAQSGG
jgi:hypothetical protein